MTQLPAGGLTVDECHTKQWVIDVDAIIPPLDGGTRVGHITHFDGQDQLMICWHGCFNDAGQWVRHPLYTAGPYLRQRFRVCPSAYVRFIR